MPVEGFVGTKDIARLLGIAPRTVTNYAQNRVITSYGPPGGLLRFRVSEVLADMEKIRRASKWKNN
ncbi:MAG: helix-turn-helix domain-containing protein [Opitutaceae bacterium]|nr:helix-turn-helix domain-containing protein [Opitutaceae bacterium]